MNETLCKNCGGALVISNTSRFVRCEYCDSTFELDPNRAKFANLYSAADDAWGRKDFDEALKLYLQITELDNLQSEAHWGAALCRYGIAYEIDPVSGEKKPTCNRTNIESIFEDKNYIAAIRHASPENKQKYSMRAAEIDRISIEFLKIVKNEAPYDVFISYKRTDGRGVKTIDAEYAMKLYIFLKNNGIKVFFAEETLKNVAGSLYEPYIFAALQSSKVMVLIGSSRENIESTWVKNEWQRFFKLMETSPQKAMIPAFIGDPYAVLPQRFQPLQAFNAGSPAFVEEILENIKKKLTDTAQRVAANDNGGQLATINSLLERAYMFVGDGEFEKSASQLEKVLDIDPKCAEAYICSLMIEFRVTREAHLASLSQRIDLSPNYKKIMAFGNEETKKRISGYSECVMKRVGEAELKRQELQQKKQNLLRMVSVADNTLGQIDAKRNELKAKIATEESSLTVLKKKITETEFQRDKIKIKKFSPLWLGLFILVWDAVFLATSMGNYQTTLEFFLKFLLPPVIVFIVVTFSSISISGIFISIGIFFVTFVVVAIINGGGILSAIFGAFIDLTIGLLFGMDKQVLTEQTLQQSLFYSGHIICVISIIVSIVKHFNILGDKKRYNQLEMQIGAYKNEYNTKAQQNTVLIQLTKELEQNNAIYNSQFVNLKNQLLKENNEYIALAQKSGQRAENVLPQRYL